MNRYVVCGEIGEYSSRKVWGVCVFDVEADAQAFVDAAANEARVLLRQVQTIDDEWSDTRDEQIDAIRCTHDPKLTGEDLSNHYDGPSYFVWELPHHHVPTVLP